MEGRDIVDVVVAILALVFLICPLIIFTSIFAGVLFILAGALLLLPSAILGFLGYWMVAL